MLNMLTFDIRAGRGVCLIRPDGDLADAVLADEPGVTTDPLLHFSLDRLCKNLRAPSRKRSVRTSPASVDGTAPDGDRDVLLIRCVMVACSFRERPEAREDIKFIPSVPPFFNPS